MKVKRQENYFFGSSFSSRTYADDGLARGLYCTIPLSHPGGYMMFLRYFKDGISHGVLVNFAVEVQENKSYKSLQGC